MSVWIQFVKKTRAANPGMSYKEAMIEAKKTYKRKPKKQKGSGPEHARFSSEIYKKPEDRQDVKEYKYISGNAEEGYWKSPAKIVIAFRGTTNKADVKTDAILAVGALKKSSRYKKSLAFAKKILKNATVPVEVSGHSLGGSLASEVARELGLKSFTYNPGVGPREAIRAKVDKAACLIRKKGKRCKRSKNHEVQRTLADPVSILGKDHPNTKTIIPKHLNVHSIKNFKQLKN